VTTSFGKAIDMLFKLKMQDDQGNKVGIHIDGDKTYHPGDVVESDVDLRKLVRNKFELVVSKSAGRSMGPAIPGSARMQNGKRKEKSIPSRSVLDVTEDYPQAQIAGVVVLYGTKTQRFAVKKDGKVVKVVKKIVTLENYLDGLVE